MNNILNELIQIHLKKIMLFFMAVLLILTLLLSFSGHTIAEDVFEIEGTCQKHEDLTVSPECTDGTDKVGARIIVCEIVDGGFVLMQYNDLTEALNEAKDGQIIRLLCDIEYKDPILIRDKIVTFDLNSFNLNVKTEAMEALTVDNGALILDDSAGGALNVTSTNILDGVGVLASNGGNATVTNAAGPMIGACAVDASKITVKGNAKSIEYGVYALDGSLITIDGVITVTAGGVYICVGDTDKTKKEGDPIPKAGYLEYTELGNFVWVRIIS